MAWIDVTKHGEKHVYRITEEAYNIIFKQQGYDIVDKAQNGVSTAQNTAVDKSTEPIPQMPSKRQYTKRNGVENK
jgi:hypothetical protein